MQHRYHDATVETLPLEQRRALQTEKLGALLSEIYGRNPFYTSKVDAAGVDPQRFTLDDLAEFPFTTKSELLEAQEQGGPLGANATYPEAAYTRFHQTSGTTGEPLRVLDTPQSWDWWSECWAMVLTGAGVTADDRLFLPFSFGPFIGFWAAVGGAEKVGALMIPGGGRGSLQRLHLMRELNVTAMCCTPTYALRLAEVARENDFDLSQIHLRVTIHAGEAGANVPATKERIQSAWGAACFDHAGASEVGAHSFECMTQPGGTHGIDSEFIFEVIDPVASTTVGSGGEGELVITNLGRPGFPVIRYRTGDVVRLSDEPCNCGRTFTRFDGGIIGRADDLVVVRGINIFPSAVENLIRSHRAVDEFRVTVAREREMAELIIELECAPGADADAMCAAVTADFENVLGLRPVVKAAPRGALPRFELKARRFTVAE